MTGVANVTSNVAFDELQTQFIERLHSHRATQILKYVWHNVCICKGAIEITQGDKKSMKDIERDMFTKFKKWASLLLDNKGEVVIGELPAYVTEKMLLTTDVGEKALYAHPKAGKSMWKKWLKCRKEIRDRDNHAIKKAIARMPGGALPSGTDFGFFLDRVIYELYVAKEGPGAKPDDVDSDHKGADAKGSDDEGNAEGNDIGGSAAKAAGPSNYMIDDTNKATGVGDGDSDSDSGVIVRVIDENEEDEEHEEPKAPGTFYPANLLVILIAGVLSNKCEPCITHVCETEGETKLAKVPSRIDVRLAALAEGLSTTSKSTDARPDALSRLKQHADYNEVYKEAAKNRDDLGRKRLKMDGELADAQVETMKKEAASREKEVAAREIEVQTGAKEAQVSALEKIYRDLREELKDAKAECDKDEIGRLKKELDEIRKMRVELVTK